MKESAEAFNVFEAFLWGSIAIALFIKSLRIRPELRKTARICSIAFLVFGASDLIELKTGAWWKPLRLLLLKVGCGIVLLGCWLAYLKQRRPDLKEHRPND